MDTIFMNSKIAEPYRLLLNLADKIDLRRSMFLYQLLACTIHRKI